MESSLCEKPERHAPRRLSDHLGLEGLKQKVHLLTHELDACVGARSSQPGDWRHGWNKYRGF